MAKMKRLAAMGVCALMIATASVLPVSANNHDDTDYNFFQYNSTVGVTTLRPKYDDSYMYMKPTSLGTPYKAHAQAAYSSTGTKYDCHNGYVFNIDVQGKEYYLNNWVYEYGYSHGAIKGEKVNVGSNAPVYGVWSPDSI